MSIKIAVTGKIRSGKDTVSHFFIERGFKRFKFGDGIKEIIEKYFPDAWSKGKPRTYYQFIGQALRQLDPDVWIKYVLKKIEESGADNVIIDDMRQLNEAKKLKELGFIIIKVEADINTRLKRMVDLGDKFNLEDLFHETEQQVDLIIPDFIVINNDSIESVYKDLEFIYNYIEQNST